MTIPPATYSANNFGAAAGDRESLLRPATLLLARKSTGPNQAISREEIRKVTTTIQQW